MLTIDDCSGDETEKQNPFRQLFNRRDISVGRGIFVSYNQLATLRFQKAEL